MKCEKGERDAKVYNRATYGKVIREARTRRGITQSELADMLSTNKNYVSNWEMGRARPDMNIVPLLCRALGISIGSLFGEACAPGEDRHLRLYRSLSPEGRHAADRMLRALADMEAERRAGDVRGRFRAVYMAEQAAAAGVFNPLEAGGRGEKIWIRRGAQADGADMVVRVSGDSMEPTFRDGDRLLVQRAEEISEGEIGLFVYNGDGLVKEYRREGLYSHNRAKYPLRRFLPGDDVRCVGRVTGTVTDDMLPDADERAILEEARA